VYHCTHYFMPFILWRQYSVTTGRQCNGLGAVYTPWVLLWPRNATRKSDLCRRACERVRLSVRLSDCLSRSCILSKRVIVFSNFSRLDHHYFSIQKLMAIFWREPPNGGIECRWGMKTRSFAPEAARCFVSDWLASTVQYLERNLLSFVIKSNQKSNQNVLNSDDKVHIRQIVSS